MSDSAKRPLLFLDVDGPLIPFGASPQQYPAGYPVYQSGYELKAASNPLLARIDPGHGAEDGGQGRRPFWPNATEWRAAVKR